MIQSWTNPIETPIKQNSWAIFGLANIRAVQGINIVTLYYIDIANNSYAINYRIVDKQEDKTKNDYFIEMMGEIKIWGIKPAWVTGNCWYSSASNLKFLRNEGLGFLFSIETNRTVSLGKGAFVISNRFSSPPAPIRTTSAEAHRLKNV